MRDGLRAYTVQKGESGVVVELSDVVPALLVVNVYRSERAGRELSVRLGLGLLLPPLERAQHLPPIRLFNRVCMYALDAEVEVCPWSAVHRLVDGRLGAAW